MFNKLNIYHKTHTRHEVAEVFSVTSTRLFPNGNSCCLEWLFPFWKIPQFRIRSSYCIICNNCRKSEILFFLINNSFRYRIIPIFAWTNLKNKIKGE